MGAFHLFEGFDLVQILEDVGWRGARVERAKAGGVRTQAANYPVPRGSLVPLSGKECLLWMHGDVQGVTDRSYFQGGRGTPKPIRLVRHAGHGSWDETARSALALAKMNW